jgi:signal transduction histidine kinase
MLPDLTATGAVTLAVAGGTHGAVSAALAVATLLAVATRQFALTTIGQHLRAELELRVARRTLELEEVTESYRRLDAMKFEFVTAVSHELRTPLAAIRGSLEMLHDGDAGELPKQAQKVVDIASRGSERLSRLVNDIIDLERLESGAFSFLPADFAISALVAEATQSLLPIAQDQRVEIDVHVEEGRAWCDADRIVQVLVNLVGNALKFSPPDTTVTVTARSTAEEVVFSVQDQGRGIPADRLEAVFERFHQVEEDDSRQKGGAGLGLAICQRIVDSHGGRIWVESSGVGATFWFTLPLPAALAAQDEHADPDAVRVPA